MPFASGTFTLTAGNPVTTGTTISSTWANNTLVDVANGLTTCVLKDGTQTMTANLPMATFKLTGLGAGSAAGDSVRYEQVFSNGTVALLGNLSVAGLTASRRVATDSTKALVSLDAITQTFLTPSNIALNNTANYFDVVNTGSIGAAGQVWRISAMLSAVDSAGAAVILGRIWDSSTVYVEAPGLAASASSAAGVNIYLSVVVTLGAATTFYLSAKDTTSTSGAAITTGNAGTANKATWIMAERIS